MNAGRGSYPFGAYVSCRRPFDRTTFSPLAFVFARAIGIAPVRKIEPARGGYTPRNTHRWLYHTEAIRRGVGRGTAPRVPRRPPLPPRSEVASWASRTPDRRGGHDPNDRARLFGAARAGNRAGEGHAVRDRAGGQFDRPAQVPDHFCGRSSSTPGEVVSHPVVRRVIPRPQVREPAAHLERGPVRAEFPQQTARSGKSGVGHRSGSATEGQFGGGTPAR